MSHGYVSRLSINSCLLTNERSGCHYISNHLLPAHRLTDATQVMKNWGLVTIYKTGTHSRTWLPFGTWRHANGDAPTRTGVKEAVGTRCHAFDDPVLPSNQVARSRAAVTHEHQQVPVPAPPSPPDDLLTGATETRGQNAF